MSLGIWPEPWALVEDDAFSLWYYIQTKLMRFLQLNWGVEKVF